MTAMPFCMRCGRTGVVTFGSICGRCLAADERESDEMRETAREAGKGWRRERDR
jgi:NMD protein affecting ribosome stability and mRNA decay